MGKPVTLGGDQQTRSHARGDHVHGGLRLLCLVSGTGSILVCFVHAEVCPNGESNVHGVVGGLWAQTRTATMVTTLPHASNDVLAFRCIHEKDPQTTHHHVLAELGAQVHHSGLVEITQALNECIGGNLGGGDWGGEGQSKHIAEQALQGLRQVVKGDILPIRLVHHKTNGKYVSIFYVMPPTPRVHLTHHLECGLKDCVHFFLHARR